MLFVQINRKREEMILLGNLHGLTSPATINASHQLDRLLNYLLFEKAKKQDIQVNRLIYLIDNTKPF
ncbi:aspartyl-phosphate phosphatase Spo0E family protein [Peribacillus sp. NPDC096447]|uniref:aspartyl-phosphate phosphatase Spo0E family protein n=1 Tax=Peribacillus sp. NPDC096447 TaxID=3364394 RepID=UPI003817ED1F